MEMNSFDAEIENENIDKNITYVCFVGSNMQDILAPLWFYGSAVKNICIFFNSDYSSVAAAVFAEIMSDPVFSGIEISSTHYSRRDTNIDTFKRNFEKRIPMNEESSEIVINISGCSKPVYLSMILFAVEHNSSIILSVKYNCFEIFEDGVTRIQTLPHKIKWYLSHFKLRIYPKLSSDREKDPVIPEKVLQDKPGLIQEYLMESTITGKNWTLNINFACTTKKLLIIGKMFTEDGESFDLPSRIFSESLRNFGGNCRILVYAVGDNLYQRLQQRLDGNKYVSLVNIPDPWCLVEYPEYFELDLMKTINKKI